MDRNSYPTLERFEIAHRELLRPNNDPIPEAKNRSLHLSAGRQTVTEHFSHQNRMLEVHSLEAMLAV